MGDHTTLIAGFLWPFVAADVVFVTQFIDAFVPVGMHGCDRLYFVHVGFEDTAHELTHSHLYGCNDKT
jgi:hypothetical protein